MAIPRARVSEVVDATVDVQLAAGGGDIPDVNTIRSWVRRALEGADVSGALEVSVRIIEPVEMQDLNRRYRDRDLPTNVLSFPAGQVSGVPSGARRALGDIAVCAAVVQEEARQQGKAPGDHWAHMLVHGTLHLLGFDHAEDDEARDMEALEARILETAGISDPYRVL